MYRHTKTNRLFFTSSCATVKNTGWLQIQHGIVWVQNGLQNRAASTNNDGQMGCNMGCFSSNVVV